MKFTWDPEKNRQNKKKHDLSFEIAAKVFGDPLRLEKYDELHSAEEDRYITIGRIETTLVIVAVAYTEREQTIRIISARTADKQEKEAYWHGNENGRYRC